MFKQRGIHFRCAKTKPGSSTGKCSTNLTVYWCNTWKTTISVLQRTSSLPAVYANQTHANHYKLAFTTKQYQKTKKLVCNKQEHNGLFYSTELSLFLKKNKDCIKLVKSNKLRNFWIFYKFKLISLKED